jgi:hypothetical protein
MSGLARDGLAGTGSPAPIVNVIVLPRGRAATSPGRDHARRLAVASAAPGSATGPHHTTDLGFTTPLALTLEMM